MVRLLGLPMVFAVVGVRGGFLGHGHLAQLWKGSEASQEDSAASWGPNPGASSGGPRSGAAADRRPGQGDSRRFHNRVRHGFPETPNFEVSLGSGETETDFLKNLWAGHDYPTGVFSVPGLTQPSQFNDHQQGNVQIFGLPNSGTTLLRALLYANWGSGLNYFDDDVPVVRGSLHDGIYKHSNFKILYSNMSESLQKLVNDKVSAIFMVRNPYGWLNSMRTSFPNGKLIPKVCVTGEDWLYKPCVVENPVGARVNRVQKVVFDSLPEVWNQWTDAYLHQGKFGIADHYVIAFENLVRNPEEVLSNVARFMRLTPPRRYVVPFNTEERQDELNLIVSGNVTGDSLNNMEKYTACVRLNHEHMKMLHFENGDIQCTGLVPSGSESGFDPAVFASDQPQTGFENDLQPPPAADADFFRTVDRIVDESAASLDHGDE